MNSKNNKGFTLLEVLVAFSILAITLAVLFRVHAQGSRSTQLSSQYVKATLIAQSQLANAKLIRTELGETDGLVDDYFIWKLNTHEYYGDEELSNSETIAIDNKTKLEKIDISVSWPKNNPKRTITLTTYQLVKKS